MIHYFYGTNDLGIFRAVNEFREKFIKKYDTESVVKLDVASIPSQKIMSEIINVNLFSPNRLIILSGVAENKTFSESLLENLLRIPDDVELVIIEPSPDKRTKTFKELVKKCNACEFRLPKDYDMVKFTLNEANNNRVEIKRDAVDELIIYTDGNPWRIASEIAKFKTLGKLVTVRLVQELVEPELTASAFLLMDCLLSGDRDKAAEELAKLRKIEKAEKFFGLLSSQVFALAIAVNANGRSSQNVASETNIHPFVMGKMFIVARRVNEKEIKRITRIIAETDNKLKSTGIDPWTLIELAISKI